MRLLETQISQIATLNIETKMCNCNQIRKVEEKLKNTLNLKNFYEMKNLLLFSSRKITFLNRKKHNGAKLNEVKVSSHFPFSRKNWLNRHKTIEQTMTSI